jgi:hypothetical protein
MKTTTESNNRHAAVPDSFQLSQSPIYDLKSEIRLIEPLDIEPLDQLFPKYVETFAKKGNSCRISIYIF